MPDDFLALTWTWPHDWSPARAAHVATLAPLLAAMAVAARVDWRTRRIPNWLTFSLLGLGLLRAIALWIGGAGDFTPLTAIAGAGVGLVVSVPLYALGARGAGDSKLYIAAGAWVGPLGVVALFVIEAIVGAAWVLVRAVARGQSSQLLMNAAVLVTALLHARRLGLATATATGRRYSIYGPVPDDAPPPRFASFDRPLPHAVPLLAAAVLAVLMGKL